MHHFSDTASSANAVLPLLLWHAAVLHRCGLLLSSSMVWQSQSWAVQKNSWADQDAAWDVDFGGSKEPHIRWGGPELHAGAILRAGEGRSIAKLCHELHKNSCTNRDADWNVDLGRPKEACIRQDCTLAPPGAHDWTIRVWRRCSLMSNYSDHLLLLILLLRLQTWCLDAWTSAAMRSMRECKQFQFDSSWSFCRTQQMIITADITKQHASTTAFTIHHQRHSIKLTKDAINIV